MKAPMSLLTSSMPCSLIFFVLPSGPPISTIAARCFSVHAFQAAIPSFVLARRSFSGRAFPAAMRGWVSVISDLWKALGLIIVVVLFREKRQWAATAASVIWGACLLYSVTSAVGAAIEDRSSRTGNRETIVMNYDEFTADAKRLEEKRNGLRAHRSAPIVEAAISALFTHTVESYRRTSSTVGEVSANCQHTDQRTTDVCAEVAQLREELAAAKEENELNREIAKLKGEARDLRARGAIKSSDPQAELLSSVTGGWLSPRDVGRALALLLGMTIEFVSAFGPTVLLSYAEATERPDDVPAEAS